jgi:hypothetical protein
MLASAGGVTYDLVASAHIAFRIRFMALSKGEIAMLWKRAFAAGLVVAVSLGASLTALAPAALASGRAPAATGSFSSWSAAQHAAGFQLKRPTSLHGLKRSTAIVVTRCEVTGKQKKREVFVSYGSSVFKHRVLGLEQNNSGGQCGNLGEVKTLATYRVHGAKATLFGACGSMGEPACNKRDIFLFLTWKKGGIAYEASSRNEWRGTLVSFSRSTKSVA